MCELLSKLWRDDAGAVLTAELPLIMGVCVLGCVPVLVQIRQGTAGAMPDMAAAVLRTSQEQMRQVPTPPITQPITRPINWPAP